MIQGKKKRARDNLDPLQIVYGRAKDCDGKGLREETGPDHRQS